MTFTGAIFRDEHRFRARSSMCSPTRATNVETCAAQLRDVVLARGGRLVK
jgi:hypothetical protein